MLAHADRLRAACEELTGHDTLAEDLVRDLLAAVALRWPWWRLRGRAGRPARGRRYLDRMLHRQAGAWPRGREDVQPAYRLEGERRPLHPAERRWASGGPTRLRLIEASTDTLTPPPVNPDADATVATTELVGTVWARAGRLRANRVLVATVVVIMAGCLFAASPRLATHLPTPIPPDPLPTALPAGVLVLPAFGQLGGLSQLGTLFRATIDLDSAAPSLKVRTLTRAIAVLRHENGPLYAVGPDASLRVLDDPVLAKAQLLTTSLSPDGQRAALGGPDGLLVVDLTTGAVRPINTGGPPAVLTWRSNRTLIVPRSSGSLLVAVDTGTSSAIAAVSGQDVVTVQAGGSFAQLIELIPPDRPPARIRLWRTAPAVAVNPTPATSPTGDLEDRPIFGPPWIGTWTGPGYAGGDLLVRGCAASLIAMPAGRAARSAIGAVNTTGLYASTLITLDGTQLDLLGFADPKTVLINATGDTGSVIVAWSPNAGTLLRVASLPTTARISLSSPEPSA